jgi:hypothetical protein
MMQNIFQKENKFLISIFSLIIINVFVCQQAFSMENDALGMFEVIKEKVPQVKPFDIQDSKYKISGHYSDSGPSMAGHERLSGSDLYLFPDGTYIYTEWADIMPETVYEKGNWKFEDSFISFTNDNSLKKAPSLEKKYFVFLSLNETIFLMASTQAFEYFQTMELLPITSTVSEAFGSKADIRSDVWNDYFREKFDSDNNLWMPLTSSGKKAEMKFKSTESLGSMKAFKQVQKKIYSNAEYMMLLNSFEKEEEITSDNAESLKAKLMAEAWRPEFFNN